MGDEPSDGDIFVGSCVTPEWAAHIIELSTVALACAWTEGYVQAMADFVPNLVPVLRRDRNPYRERKRRDT